MTRTLRFGDVARFGCALETIQPRVKTAALTAPAGRGSVSQLFLLERPQHDRIVEGTLVESKFAEERPHLRRWGGQHRMLVLNETGQRLRLFPNPLRIDKLNLQSIIHRTDAKEHVAGDGKRVLSGRSDASN